MLGSKRVMAGLANIAFERAHAYGTPLGQMEEDLEQAGGKVRPGDGNDKNYKRRVSRVR